MMLTRLIVLKEVVLDATRWFLPYSLMPLWLWIARHWASYGVGSTTQYAPDQYCPRYWVEYTLPDNCMASLSSARKISSIFFTPSSPWETMKKEDKGRLQWHTCCSFIDVFPPSGEFSAENITQYSYISRSTIPRRYLVLLHSVQ